MHASRLVCLLVALTVVGLLLTTRRIGWRLAAIAIVACSAVLGGDAIVYGAQTAVAVSL